MPNQKRIYIKDIQDKLNNPYLLYTSNFFDEKEQMLLQPILNRAGRDFTFIGGYPEAQRKILVIPPDYEDITDIKIPIAALLFDKPCDLTHRHVLGTLLSLGVNRDTIGDIAIWEDKVQVIIQEHLSEYFLNNFKFINNHPIEPVLLDYDEIIPYTFNFTLETCTAASKRLDAVIASIFKTSRKKAIEYIRQGLVLYNHLPLKKFTNSVQENDTLSMKGRGKIKIKDFGGKTKKGRIRVNYKKYL